MISRLRRVHAFSLVELTLALGVAAFCLIALFGLIPLAVQTNRNATSQTRAANILSSTVTDLRAAPVPGPVQSTMYGITIPGASASPSPQIRYFDREGRCSTDLAGSTRPDGSAWSPAIQTRYQLTITFTNSSPTPAPPAVPTTYAYLKLIWPPAVSSPAPLPSGSAEMFAAFDRN